MQHILISTLALSPTEHEVLTIATNLLADEGLDCIVLDKNDIRGHIVIIDTENNQQQNLLKHIRAGQIKVLLGTSFYTDKNIVSLAKPISANTLKELIYKISIKLKGQVNNNPSDLPINQIEILNKTLFHILLNAKSNNKLIKISCFQHSDIYVDGINNTIAASAQPTEIDNILMTTLDKCTINDITKIEYKKLIHKLNIYSLNGKLWYSGITGSKGILLSGHDINKPFKLKAWPNFTRNAYKPEHLKLAAILARQSSTVSELEVLTNITRSEIINFYNAAYSVGLIEKIENNNQVQTMDKKSPPTTRNILHRFAVRLHLD